MSTLRGTQQLSKTIRLSRKEAMISFFLILREAHDPSVQIFFILSDLSRFYLYNRRFFLYNTLCV